MARFTVASVKMGDILTGGDEKQGGMFYDWRYRVLVKGGAHKKFTVQRVYSDDSAGTIEYMTGAELTAGMWNRVWRDSVLVGTFFVTYW